MKILLIFLFPCIAQAQYRPMVISSVTPQAIMRNFNQVAIRVNRSLDRFGNDTVYGSPTFQKNVVFNGTNTFTGQNTFTNLVASSSPYVSATLSGTPVNNINICYGTATITTNGAALHVDIAVNANHTTASSNQMGSGIMVNGLVRQAIYQQAEQASVQANLSHSMIFPVAAGTHNVCGTVLCAASTGCTIFYGTIYAHEMK